MIKAGIVGGSGYTAGELIRLLLNHPDVNLRWIHSRSHAGERLDSVHKGLVGETNLSFGSEAPLDEIDVLFMCTQHGSSKDFIDSHELPPELKVIDMSQDFRKTSDEHDFVYGLPELNRRRIVHDCVHVANPGSFATAVELALLPMAKNLMLNSPLHINSIMGSTGVGSRPEQSVHYSWRSSNMQLYKPFKHEQIDEIKQTLSALQMSFKADIDFIPMHGPFTRGVFTTIYMDCNIDIDELKRIYNEYYDDHNFTFVVEAPVDLKDVVNTNKCLINLERVGSKLIITSVIDNLLKGGSGTAVHNMNLLFGLHERVGLMLKATAF